MRRSKYMEMFRSTAMVAVMAAVAMACCAARAADYYWSGAAGDDDGTNPGNWIDVNGNAMTVAPGADDALIVTSAVDKITYPIATTNRGSTSGTQFRKVVLAGDVSSVVNFALGLGGSGVPLFFPPEGFINLTERGTLRYSIGNLQCIEGSASLRATNLVHVANPNAVIDCPLHMKGGNEYSDVIKTGYGTYIPWTGNCYPKKRRQLVQQGVYKFATATKAWNTDYIGFVGDDPTATLCFAKKDVVFGFVTPLVEENVTTSDHTMTDANVGSTLALTGKVTNASFTGRVRGKLSFEWSPWNASYAFTFSKGASDTTGTLTVSNGTVNVTQGASFSSLKAVKLVEGGKLSMAGGASVAATSLTLDPSTGSSVTLAVGTHLNVADATAGGTALPAGIYTGGDWPWLAGEGLLVVSGVAGADIVVPYDAEQGTATVVDLTASPLTAAQVAALGRPFRIALSEVMALPFHATNRIAVAEFAASVGVTAADFVDVSPKTCDLPRTWFETETANGVTTVYLVARPVVVALGEEGDGVPLYHYFMTNANFWSDGKLPHAGADYFDAIDTTTGDKSGAYSYDYGTATGSGRVFPGESLTFSASRYSMKTREFTVNDLRFYNATSGMQHMYSISVSGETHMRGKIYVDASCSAFEIRPNLGDSLLVIDSDISSKAGNLTFRNLWSTSPLCSFKLLGDNRGIEGRIVITGGVNAGKDLWNQLTVAITNATALGGAMEAWSGSGLQFSYFPQLIVEETTTFDTTNRGVYAREGFRLKVEAGKTFTLLNTCSCSLSYTDDYMRLLPARCAVEKSGEGVFAFGARLVPCNTSVVAVPADGTNNMVRVKEGGVMAVTADAFDNVAMEFHDGTSIVADPANAATAANGLRLADVPPTFVAGAKVALRPIEGFVPNDAAVEVAYLTVPASTPDLRDILTVAKIEAADGKTWSPSLRKTTVGGVTTYSVLYRRLGCTIIFR